MNGTGSWQAGEFFNSEESILCSAGEVDARSSISMEADIEERMFPGSRVDRVDFDARSFRVEYADSESSLARTSLEVPLEDPWSRLPNRRSPPFRTGVSIGGTFTRPWRLRRSGLDESFVLVFPEDDGISDMNSGGTAVVEVGGGDSGPRVVG